MWVGGGRVGAAWVATLAAVAVLSVSAAGLMLLAQSGLTLQTPAEDLLSRRMVPTLSLLFFAAAAVGVSGLKRKTLRPVSRWILLVATGLAGGLLLLIPYENAHVLESGHLGLSNVYEVSLLLLAVTGALALGFDHAHAPGRLLPFVSPLLAVGAAFLWWLQSVGAGRPSELMPALQNTILPFHVAANFIGYGCFAVAAAAGAAMLLRLHADARGIATVLPPVESMDALARRAVMLGFPVFTLAIFLGCVWAYQAWGGYWSWDPKETWALVVWLLYAGYLHARGVAPRVRAWWLLGGFAATLFCYLGVNMLLSGLHSYGSLQQ